jgi:hypothetical protein
MRDGEHVPARLLLVVGHVSPQRLGVLAVDGAPGDHLTDAIGGIPSFNIPSFGSSLLDNIPGFSSAKKVLKKLNPFADGGIITSRTDLASFGGLSGQSAFASGGLLDPFTFLRGGNLKPANAVAGEAGPEAILPLTRTSGGQLGVKAVTAANGPANLVQIILVRDASREQMDALERRLDRTDASVEVRSAAVVEGILGGVGL